MSALYGFGIRSERCEWWKGAHRWNEGKNEQQKSFIYNVQSLKVERVRQRECSSRSGGYIHLHVHGKLEWAASEMMLPKPRATATKHIVTYYYYGLPLVLCCFIIIIFFSLAPAVSLFAAAFFLRMLSVRQWMWRTRQDRRVRLRF